MPVKNEDGTTYYSVDYDVVLNFGLTELQAQLRWWENVSTPPTSTCYTQGNDLLLRLLQGVERRCVLRIYFAVCFEFERILLIRGPAKLIYDET